MANITILGSGGFGIGLAVMLHKHGHHITVWSKFQKELDDIRKNGEQVQKLPGVVIPPEIGLSASLECIRGSDLVLFGIPPPLCAAWHGRLPPTSPRIWWW